MVYVKIDASSPSDDVSLQTRSFAENIVDKCIELPYLTSFSFSGSPVYGQVLITVLTPMCMEIIVVEGLKETADIGKFFFLNKAQEVSIAIKHLLFIQFSFGTQEVMGRGQDEGRAFGVGLIEKSHYSPHPLLVSTILDIFGVAVEGKCETSTGQPVTKT